jgi:hypothetical protein
MAKEIDYLELADILKLGQEIISDFRIRDLGLLESAVARPRTSVFKAYRKKCHFTIYDSRR